MKKVNWFILIGMICLGCNATKETTSIDSCKMYEQLSAFYHNQSMQGEPIRFYKSDRIQQIVLIRHGQPKVNQKKSLSRKGMKQFILEYDQVDVHPFSKSPVNIGTEEIDTIYVSPLSRARSTADQIFGDEFVIATDGRFREFEREVFPLPLLHLRPKTWRILSRIPWLMGIHSGKIEGFRMARQRARKDAIYLEQKADQDNRVLLVAHGFLNRYLQKYLQQQGWQLSYDGGKDYLSVQVLSKVVK